MHYNKSLCCREQREGKHLLPTCQDDYKVIRFSAALIVVMQTHHNKTLPETKARFKFKKSNIHNSSNVHLKCFCMYSVLQMKA